MSNNCLVINVKWAIKIHASSLRNDDFFFPQSRLGLESEKYLGNKIERKNLEETKKIGLNLIN